MAQARITMASNGRVVIPAGMRNEVGLGEGGTLVARVENGAVILEPYRIVVERARALVRQHAPAGPGVVEEFLAERRAEAARE